MHTASIQSGPSSESAPPPGPSRGRTGLIFLFALLLILVLIVVLPPLVNVSRFQKRIATNISNALGRPVHFDHVSLTLLPMPGFTLQKFTIDEDPAFGYEPVLYAGQVDVTLRLSSLWHPHVEFSKISFTEPSVNLVRSKGHLNIESLLLQASHLEAAPTGQSFAGPARRFPYIEATGARVNLKFDQEKSPVSLTDADFALWLPEPHQWHLRLEAHPVRTDASTTDTGTGTIRVDGTLGGTGLNAASLADIPIDLQGDWRNAQLGGISRLLIGRDPGIRGDFTLTFALRGTVGNNAITTGVKLANARRADFVPDSMLSLAATCRATAGATFSDFTAIQCSASDATPLSIAGEVPDVRNLDMACAALTIPALPADTFFGWLAVATPHPPSVLAGAGTLSANLSWGCRPSQSAFDSPALTGQIAFTGGSLSLDAESNHSLPLGDVILRSSPTVTQPAPHGHPAAISPAPDSFDLQPLSLDLGGPQPATLEAHFDASGYTLHLSGSALIATLHQMANAVPQFGDGLISLLDSLTPEPASQVSGEPSPPAPPIRVDLTATRIWGGPQIWTQTRTVVPAPARTPKR